MQYNSPFPSPNSGGGYERAKKIIDKRLNRFFKCCKSESKICFIMAVAFCADMELIEKLYNVVKTKYNMPLIFLVIGADEDNDITKDNLRIIKSTRKPNVYDCTYTNYEWAFLDGFRVRGRGFFKIRKIKKGFSVNLFNFMPIIFKLLIYLFGFRIIICLGKDRKVE